LVGLIIILFKECPPSKGAMGDDLVPPHPPYRALTGLNREGSFEK